MRPPEAPPRRNARLRPCKRPPGNARTPRVARSKGSARRSRGWRPRPCASKPPGRKPRRAARRRLGAPRRRAESWQPCARLWSRRSWPRAAKSRRRHALVARLEAEARAPATRPAGGRSAAARRLSSAPQRLSARLCPWRRPRGNAIRPRVARSKDCATRSRGWRAKSRAGKPPGRRSRRATTRPPAAPRRREPSWPHCARRSNNVSWPRVRRPRLNWIWPSAWRPSPCASDWPGARPRLVARRRLEVPPKPDARWQPFARRLGGRKTAHLRTARPNASLQCVPPLQPAAAAEPARPASKVRYGEPEQQQAPTPRELWLRGATNRSTPFVAEQAVVPLSSDRSANADLPQDVNGAPQPADAGSKNRDRRIAGQFGRINAPGKAVHGKPAPDKSPLAKSTKPTPSPGLWRRPLAPAD